MVAYSRQILPRWLTMKTTPYPSPRPHATVNPGHARGGSPGLKTPPFSLSVPHKSTSPQLPRPEPLPACVAPRRRFIVRFTWICAALTLAGILITLLRRNTPDDNISMPMHLIMVIEFPLMLLPGFLPMLIRTRTKRGTLLQLIGLIIPLLLAIISFVFCWVVNEPDEHLAFFMAIGWLSWGGGLYIALPCAAIHIIVHMCSRRFCKRH